MKIYKADPPSHVVRKTFGKFLRRAREGEQIWLRRYNERFLLIGEQDIEFLARECPEFFDDEDAYVQE